MERQRSYQDLDDDTLYVLLGIHRKTLGLLEQQAATFGFLHVPPHIIHSIEREREEISSIKAKLLERGRDSNNEVGSIVEIDQNKQQYVLTRKVAELLEIPPEQFPVFQALVDQLNTSRRKLGRLGHVRNVFVLAVIGTVICAIAFAIYTIMGSFGSIDVITISIINISFFLVLVILAIMFLYVFLMYLTASDDS